TLIDAAVLSGGANPTGTITFVLTGPGGFSYTQTDVANGDGTYTAGDRLPTSGSVAGTYTWSAHYSGDGNNASANDQGGAAEHTIVNPAQPAIATITNRSRGTVGARSEERHVAVECGGCFETGTLNFTLKGPGW